MQILKHYFAPDGPGAALAVAADSETPLIECVGLANVEDRIAITAETPFELASASKWFTAAAILLLAERESLDLQAPLHAVLPQLEGDASHRPLTIRDLLWHTSGLVDYLHQGGYTPAEEMTKDYVLAQLPSWVAAAVPGREHQYSNTNYFCLARVVEAVAGSEFSEFVAANLVEPFGMSSTSVGAQGLNQSRALGYQNLGYGIPTFQQVPETPIDTDGDGGLVSSLNDLLKWQAAFWGGQILNDESLRRMQTPGTLDSGESFPYGMGLQIEKGGSAGCWHGHGGSWTNTTVLMGRYTNLKTTIILLSNEWMAPVERLYQRAALRDE